MTENQNSQDGDPNPHEGSSPYEPPAAPPQPEHPPVYFDPNSVQNSHLPPDFVYTGNPGGGKSAYLYPEYAAGRNRGAVSQKEADRIALIALVFGVISPFFLGLFLSIPGYFMARHAEIANGYNAKPAKIVNLVSSILSVLIGLFFVFIFTIAGVNHLQ